VFLADIHPSQQGILSQQVLGQKSLHLCTRTPNTTILFYTKLHIPSFSDQKKCSITFWKPTHVPRCQSAKLVWLVIRVWRCHDGRWQDLTNLLLAKHNCAFNRAHRSYSPSNSSKVSDNKRMTSVPHSRLWKKGIIPNIPTKHSITHCFSLHIAFSSNVGDPEYLRTDTDYPSRTPWIRCLPRRCTFQLKGIAQASAILSAWTACCIDRLVRGDKPSC
jgi:hypothetical protein